MRKHVPSFDVFDLYFSNIVAFQYHPANPAATRMTLAEAAEVALDCVRLRDRLLSQLEVQDGDIR